MSSGRYCFYLVGIATKILTIRREISFISVTSTCISSFLAIPYRVLIFPRQKTSANCWFSLAGQLGETPHVSIAKHTLDYVYEVSKAKLHGL